MSNFFPRRAWFIFNTSFAVKEIVKDIDRDIEKNFFEINMAQLTSPRELASYLLRVNDVIAAGKTPSVFFDEFDCDFNGELGWLKYFLAPMEGGTFRHPDEGMFKIGRGIFAFAGETSSTYKKFVERKSTAPRSTGKSLPVPIPSEFEVFQKAKGPDFLSRIRAHINVKGINLFLPRPGLSDSCYVLRRAIILRLLLERNGLIDEVSKTTLIDGSLLNALLSISTGWGRGKAFAYDTRSMRTVISMCLRLHGRLEKASLPPPALLDTHIKSDILYKAMFERPGSKMSAADTMLS